MRLIRNLLLACVLALPTWAFVCADDIVDARRGLRQRYVVLLIERAERQAATKELRVFPVDEQSGRNYLYLPQLEKDQRPAILDDDPELNKLQTFYAEHLFALSQRAMREDDRALAYRLAHEALRADPQHALAKAVVNVAEQKPFRAKQVAQGWEVETQHFEITTTDTEAAARDVGARLEELHAVWRQLFADYWFTKAELERRFAGQPSRLVEPNHKVMLFANKQQYVDYLKRDEPGIAVSLGYYAERPRTAYFYSDEQTIATQFHEATHQLFHERQRRGRAAGIDDNFWVVEGVATYMESLQKGQGYFVVGGPGAYRLQFARYRALTESYYVPLSELVAMGRADMKAAGENLARLYSQSAGLAHFFMDGEDGKYREAFVEYLDAVYRDKADAATLARLTGKRYEQLDKEYLEFLRADDNDLAVLIPGENVPRLYLGRTKITDASMKPIATVAGLQWLDVGYCRITDDGVKAIPPSETLLQLNLEHTDVTNRVLPHLATMTSLKHLDLSGCRISDDGLKALAELKNLEVLWLTETAITDAGLKHLHGLKHLKFVDVDGTNVTADGFAELQQAVPGVSRQQ